MSDKDKKIVRKNFLTAKLMVYDWGWADKIMYRLIGKTNEKHKGIMMLKKIREIFGITEHDILNYEEREVETMRNIPKPVKWSRDERGNITSPFRKKKDG